MRKPTAAQKRKMNRVAQLPCAACGASPVEIHHSRHDCGMSQRNHDHLIPLCMWCHRISSISRHTSPYSFSNKYGTDKELYEQTERLLEEKS